MRAFVLATALLGFAAPSQAQVRASSFVGYGPNQGPSLGVGLEIGTLTDFPASPSARVVVEAASAGHFDDAARVSPVDLVRAGMDLVFEMPRIVSTRPYAKVGAALEYYDVPTGSGFGRVNVADFANAPSAGLGVGLGRAFVEGEVGHGGVGRGVRLRAGYRL